VAGIGCRAGVSGAQVEAAIDAAIAELCARQAAYARAEATRAAEGGSAPVLASTAAGVSECDRAIVSALATPAAKANEPGIQAAAAAWGVPLLAISQEALEAANPATVTRSMQSMAAMNVHSVAEAAALAGASALANVATTSEPSPASVERTCKPPPRLLQPRVVAGPVTCALADTTTS
jgi:Cobalamin synthesis G C-terminus